MKVLVYVKVYAIKAKHRYKQDTSIEGEVQDN